MSAYDAESHTPPAPIARVELRSSQGRRVADVPMLLDTGADISLVPRRAVASLGLSTDPLARFEVMGFDGSHTFADAVDLDMLFLNKLFRGRYLVTVAIEGVVGRDVLASVVICFDGPANEWTQQQ